MSRTRAPVLVVTCEHAGNRVPAAYRELFEAWGDVLESHRGWDPGALPMARALAQRFKAPLIWTEITRLLVEANRSAHHPALFSVFTRSLGRGAREEILERYYLPHRRRVVGRIGGLVERGARVVHVGVHTFTPELNGEVRNADIGLLYDPKRARERALCVRWEAALNEASPELRVRRNYPYRGAADGLTTSLRRMFGADDYLGIELEVNQRLATEAGARRRVIAALGASLERALRAR